MAIHTRMAYTVYPDILVRIKSTAGSQIHTKADTGLPNYQEYSNPADMKARQPKT